MATHHQQEQSTRSRGGVESPRNPIQVVNGTRHVIKSHSKNLTQQLQQVVKVFLCVVGCVFMR